MDSVGSSSARRRAAEVAKQISPKKGLERDYVEARVLEVLRRQEIEGYQVGRKDGVEMVVRKLRNLTNLLVDYGNREELAKALNMVADAVSGT